MKKDALSTKFADHRSRSSRLRMSIGASAERRVEMGRGMDQKGTLYVVATPIGNLEDMTFRAVRVLREVGLIAAEDTRHSRKLLNAHGIGTPLISLHEHNEAVRVPSLLARMLQGQTVALVSDAGTPGLSDPGFRLIRAAIDRRIPVVPVPGVSAVITALSVSGLPMNRFLFQGFLSARRTRRRQQLASLAAETGTLVFFESAGRLLPALQDISDILGNRRIVIARELTKMHESFLRMSVAEALEALQGPRVRGEITLLVSGCPDQQPEWTDDALLQRFQQLRREASLSRRDCISRVSAEAGVPKSRVYRLAAAAE